MKPSPVVCLTVCVSFSHPRALISQKHNSAPSSSPPLFVFPLSCFSARAMSHPSLSSSSSMASWVRGQRIGGGSFGTVSLAFDRSSGEAFAVKSVPLDSPYRAACVVALENEIEILKSLASPYIVRFLGDDTTREGAAGAHRNLHLELMPGGTLADLATRKDPVDEVEVRAYARCLARALRYLHAVAGVVHGDVKGRNVLLGMAPGVAKLADFGASVRILNRDGPNWGRGTPLWMAPEVARGERPGPESDVWSLGCTVIEIATGAHPWPDLRHMEPESAMFRIGFGGGVPEFPPQLSKLVGDFLDKCLRRDASERWTAEELLQHPFLAEVGDLSVYDSPRGVLDWSSSDFSDRSSECSSASNSTDAVARGRERVSDLGLFREILDWDCDGWEDVRGAGDPNLTRAVTEFNVDQEEEDDDEDSSVYSVGLAIRDLGFRGVRSSDVSSCKLSCSWGCDGGQISRHGIELSRKLFLFGWCLHQKMKVNTNIFSWFFILLALTELLSLSWRSLFIVCGNLCTVLTGKGRWLLTISLTGGCQLSYLEQSGEY